MKSYSYLGRWKSILWFPSGSSFARKCKIQELWVWTWFSPTVSKVSIFLFIVTHLSFPRRPDKRPLSKYLILLPWVGDKNDICCWSLVKPWVIVFLVEKFEYWEYLYRYIWLSMADRKCKLNACLNTDNLQVFTK